MEDGTAKKKKIVESTMMKSISSSSIRAWEDLSEDIIVTIYEKLDIRNRLKGPSLCCTSWYKASKDPSLWNKVFLPDFFDQRRGVGKACPPRQLVEFVVNRSQGLLTSITFLTNNSVQDLLLIAERCPKLKHFNMKLKQFNRVIPSRAVVEGKKIICTAISKLKELESVEVDDQFISDEIVVKTIAQHCPNFHKLIVVNSTISKETALFIVKYLPNLKTLDLQLVEIHRKDLLVIFNGCLELENVDIEGSGKISSEDEILKIGREKFKKFECMEDFCAQCEKSLDYERHYKRPCKHIDEDSFLEYIEGTKEMFWELYPEYFVDDDDDDDDDEYYYYYG